MINSAVSIEFHKTLLLENSAGYMYISAYNNINEGVDYLFQAGLSSYIDRAPHGM